MAALAAPSFATFIDFDDGAVSEGSDLSNQYAGMGVTFMAGANGHSVPNPAATSQGFASNTTMGITATDIGGGVTSPMSGLLLHSFGGWLGEDGDPVFTMVFSGGISSFSCWAGGISDLASTAVYAFDAGGTMVGTGTLAGTAGTQQLSMTGLASATEVVMTIGDWGDWVGMDNLEFQTVPEPFSIATVGLGLAAMLRRTKKA